MYKNHLEINFRNKNKKSKNFFFQKKNSLISYKPKKENPKKT